MTFDEFLLNVTRRTYQRNERYGQAFFNELSLVKPEIAEEIRATENDPFYLMVEYQGQQMDKICRLVSDRWERRIDR
jgi:hypothetical protein